MTDEKEKEVLRREFEWFLDKEYRPRLESITRQLQDCEKKFSEAYSSSGAGDLRPILINQGDMVLCTAAIEGDKIIKAEVNLKLPGRGSRPVRTTIKEHHPWKLKQIQDSANYLKDACKCLDEIKGRPKKVSCDSEETEKVTKGPVEIRKAFEDLTESLRRAESALVLPQPVSALQIYNSEKKALLRPVLPEDILVHFHISSAMLVLTVLTITHMTKGQQHTQTVTDEGTGSSYWMGTTFEQGSNVYEVSSQLQVSSLIPWVSVVLQLLQGTLRVAQDFIDKLKVFEALGLDLRPQ